MADKIITRSRKRVMLPSPEWNDHNTDNKLIVMPEEQQYNSALPRLNIEGTEFYVDIQLQEFRQVDNPNNKISFDLLQDNGKNYRIFYDTRTKNVHKAPVDTIIIVEIPSLMELDPVGMAKFCRVKEDYFTSKHPAQEVFFASVLTTAKRRNKTRQKMPQGNSPAKGKSLS